MKDPNWACVLPGCLVLMIFAGPIAAFSQEESTSAPDKTGGTTLRTQTLEVRVRPTVELVLPTGAVRQELVQTIGGLETRFRLDYNFVESTIAAEVGFFYPVWLLRPGLLFFDSVDFENTVVPRLDHGQLALLPVERYVSRRRGGEVLLDFVPAPAISFGPSFLVADLFKESLSEEVVLDDGIDLAIRIRLTLDTTRTADATEALDSGVLFRSVLGQRFRNRFEHPVSLDHTSRFTLFVESPNGFFGQDVLVIGYPIHIWRPEQTRFYSLGGDDTIRGYPTGSIDAFRYALFSTGVRPLVAPRLTFRLGNKKERGVTFHRLRVLLFLDSLAFQDRMWLDAPVQILTSAGAGFSFLLSADRGAHFRTRLYVAKALYENTKPVFYWQTSLFGLAGEL